MQLLPCLRTLGLSAVLIMATLGPPLGAATEDGVSYAAGIVQNAATLTILAAPVEIAHSGNDAFTAPAQGELLQVGDTVRTGPGGFGLITFFDGSESQLGPDSQLQIERLDAIPAIHIALLQTAGVTTNHVVPVRPGGSFQTDTPAAVAMVRGTSYVVAVTGLRLIKPLASPQQPTAQVTPSAAAHMATQADAAAATYLREPADLANALDVPDGEVVADRAALKDDAPLEAARSSTDQVAATARQARALEPAVSACHANDKPQCLTTVVLLADPDGRVGRVVVESRASLAAVELTKPGDLGATSTRSVARAQLSAGAVEQLQHKTQNLRDTQAAAATAAEVQRVVKAIEPVVAPDARPDVAPGAAGVEQAVAPVAEVPVSTPTPGPSPTAEALAVLVVVDVVAVARVTDEPTTTATATPTVSLTAEARVEMVLAKPADNALSPAVTPASPAAVASATPRAAAPELVSELELELEKMPFVEVMPAVAPQTLAAPGVVNDIVPAKPTDPIATRNTVAQATPASIAPAASGAVPPVVLIATATPEAERLVTVRVTPVAVPSVITSAATPAPSPVPSPVSAPLATTVPTGSPPPAVATAPPATSAPNTSPVPPITSLAPLNSAPTPRVP